MFLQLRYCRVESKRPLRGFLDGIHIFSDSQLYQWIIRKFLGHYLDDLGRLIQEVRCFLNLVMPNPSRKPRAYRSKRVPVHQNSAALSLKVDFLLELTEAIQSTVNSLDVPAPIDVPVPIPALSNRIDFFAEVKRCEISLIHSALQHAHGSQLHAARLLNLKPTTLNAKIKLYDIHWKCFSKACDSDASCSES